MVEVEQIGAGPFDSNIFLVREGDTNVLIDAGSGFYNSGVENEIRKFLGDSSLDGIILTHEHFDHSGGAKYLSNAFDAHLFASPECARALRESNDQLTGAFLFGAHMEPILDIIEIGSELKIAEIDFEVISTPGHAPGLISLITEDDRKLFCGDLIFCDGGVGRWDLPGGNLDQHRHSINSMKEWKISSIYPGHGRVELKDPGREIEMAIIMVGSV